ncbi:MAG TPA: hypothetical protein VGM22_15395 [Methylomirabilota bacterium]
MIRRLAPFALAWLGLSAVAAAVCVGAACAADTIQFATLQQAPPPDMPREARHAGPVDSRDHGPLGALVARRLRTLEVTWWEPKVFVKQATVRDYLARLLVNPRGATVTFQPWAQRLPVANLAADVVETDGRRGRLRLWHQQPSIYAVWHDADGRWWFAYWMDDPDLRVPADGP